MSERARFFVDPVFLLGDLLPPGNVITGVALDAMGRLVFEVEGIDAPMATGAEGERTLALMLGISPNGARSSWFEPARRLPPPSLDDPLRMRLQELLAPKKDNQ